jgi:hypothetical protein
MAGGIFVNQPFYPNPKCLLFSGALMAGYWFLPYRNALLLPVLFVVSYIAMAWYDYFYECSSPLFSGSADLGLSTLDSWGKPQRRGGNPRTGYTRAKENRQEQLYRRKIYLLHTLVIAPLLLYVGLRGSTADSRVWPVVVAVGILALLYHGFRLFFPRKDGEPFENPIQDPNVILSQVRGLLDKYQDPTTLNHIIQMIDKDPGQLARLHLGIQNQGVTEREEEEETI